MDDYLAEMIGRAEAFEGRIRGEGSTLQTKRRYKAKGTFSFLQQSVEQWLRMGGSVPFEEDFVRAELEKRETKSDLSALREAAREFISASKRLRDEKDASKHDGLKSEIAHKWSELQKQFDAWE